MFRQRRAGQVVAQLGLLFAFSIIACSSNEPSSPDDEADDPKGAGMGGAGMSGGASGEESSNAGRGGMGGAAGNTASAGTQSTAGMTAAGSGGMMAAGSGGTSAQDVDSGVAQDAGEVVDAAIDNPPGCPSTYAELMAESTCSANAGCSYPEGYCSCVGRCSGIPPDPNDPPVEFTWSCMMPEEGCPPGIPTPDSACDDEGRACYYGSCCVQRVTCAGGSWNVGAPMCPP